VEAESDSDAGGEDRGAAENDVHRAVRTGVKPERVGGRVLGEVG
jgi:hypothetical protein